MNRFAWSLVVLLTATLAISLFSPLAQSQDRSTKNPFVAVTCDPQGRWLAIRSNGEVYVSEGKTWLSPMEYRYTIEVLEEALSKGKK